MNGIRWERRKTVLKIRECILRGDIITSLEIAVVNGMTIEQYTVLYRQILIEKDATKGGE